MRACIYCRMISDRAHTCKTCKYLDPSVKEESLKVKKSMQRPGNEPIRTQTQSSKSKWETNKKYKMQREHIRVKRVGSFFPKW